MHRLALIPCPLCGEAARFLPAVVRFRDDHLAKYGDLYAGRTSSEWKVCGTCGFVFQNPRPSIEALNEFYLTSRYHTEIPDAWQDLPTYVEFARGYYSEKIDFALARSGLRAGHVFDIGFGHGGALRVFRERGWSVAGVEPDERLFEFGRRLIDAGDLYRSILGRSEPCVAPVDLVFSNHTFEHVADLHDLMEGVVRILKPGGFLFTCVPTYAANRSTLSLKWMNAAHYSLFSHRSFNRLLSRYGLEEVAHTYRGWRREIDDLWHLARFTGRPADSATFSENPHRVRRFVNVVNPLRSALYWPVFSDYPRRIEEWKTAAYAARLLVRSPGTFCSKVIKRLRRRSDAPPPKS